MPVSIDALIKQLAMMRVAHEKLGEQIAALDALMQQEATPAEQARQALGHFGRAWAARYRDKYLPNYPREIPICKRMLASLTLEQLTERMNKYLADGDVYYVTRKHPLGMLATNLNKFGNGTAHAMAAADDEFLSAPPVGCRHRPACRTDHEHTQRDMADHRGRSASASART